MNDKKQLKDQHREKHPGFDRYIECQTRAFLTGLGTFTIGE